MFSSSSILLESRRTSLRRRAFSSRSLADDPVEYPTDDATDAPTDDPTGDPGGEPDDPTDAPVDVPTDDSTNLISSMDPMKLVDPADDPNNVDAVKSTETSANPFAEGRYDFAALVSAQTSPSSSSIL